MQLPISYFKRFKMEVDLAGLPPPRWPDGYEPVAWRPDLLEAHSEVLARCFVGEIDATVFPSLGSTFGCRGLMTEIARRRAFIPESTWLAVGPAGPCGTVQALRDRGVFGGIQNVGIVPEARGAGVGTALLLQSLHGMARTGLGRGVLEVTAQNESAIRLYQRLGFRRAKVVYKAVPPCLTPLGRETAIPVF